ncbi:MAG: DEAD/DEAH box helicase family protein [Gammaproteobacteria bacterium]|nr:DEAD/DEAH box helicase family protein [Gammaproteobacteria bacterium]
MNPKEIAAIQERLSQLEAEKAKLENRLAELQAMCTSEKDELHTKGLVTNHSGVSEKIALFRSLFRGREDVFPKRWQNARAGKAGYAPACGNEWKPGICGKPKVKCGECPNQDFLRVTDEVVDWHLRGRQTIGVYPMLADGDCWFLAADFDKQTWQRDAAAFLATCRLKQIPSALERSRSGNGGHVWIFFAEPAPVALARRLGTHLFTETMKRNPDIGFESYDRLFPSQDTMPTGGFGNLIALPLQHGPRQNGNSVFLDESFEPYRDQWAFLSTLSRLSLAKLMALVEAARRQDQVIDLRRPLDEENEEPWDVPPSRLKLVPDITVPLPRSLDVVLSNQIYIPRAGLPPGVINQLIRLAAFQNPVFYRTQAMRLSTFGIPRIISCGELLSHHLALPRGSREEMEQLFKELGVSMNLRDERHSGHKIKAGFLGELTSEQKASAEALLAHDTGVLAATTAFGKTVIAAFIIAARKTNTLILVHRRQLMEQWIARLSVFLDLPASSIGQIGGGKRQPTGIVDVAVIQSMVRKGEVDDVISDYGHLVVDECHHISAVSFEAVSRYAKAKYVLGLSATVTRKDGHHPIIFMQCGPVRFRTTAKAQARKRAFKHRVVLRPTEFQLSAEIGEQRIPVQRIYTALSKDETRNTLIFDDVLKTLDEQRSPVIITERKDHAFRLSERLSRFARNVLLLHGGMGVRQRREILQRLEEVPETEERVLIATGRYIGEGFDDARLDTLFLVMPVSWKGVLAQYVGRLHRPNPEKREVLVYDYVDNLVPMLKRMSEKRLRGYENLGYLVENTNEGMR